MKIVVGRPSRRKVEEAFLAPTPGFYNDVSSDTNPIAAIKAIRALYELRMARDRTKWQLGADNQACDLPVQINALVPQLLLCPLPAAGRACAT